MCTEEFIRMMFTVDLYGNRGLDSRRRMYTHNAHPCFEWYIPNKSPILQEFANVESGNINGGFFLYFWKIQGMNLQNNIWRMKDGPSQTDV